ncbi:MAG: 3'-5' exonuclease [Bacteroidota bacterium]|nr:3'-5' exonuclease [Bacteroidota bacterium]
MSQIPISSIIFFDIETVPGTPNFEDLSERMQGLWGKKSGYFRKEDETAQDVYQRAGIYSEFGKIVCISAGHVSMKGGERTFRLKSYYGTDEAALLRDFADMLNKFAATGEKFLCGHNSSEFDIPYVARRMLVNGIPLPEIINIAGKKPWEVKHLDTMNLWKFGDYKHYTSLDLLTAIFDIPTPKDDIDGSQVASVYYEENDVTRIAKYCEKDVLAVVQLYLRMQNQALIKEENVEYSVE